MDTFIATLNKLAPVHDEELSEGYTRYANMLASFLAPEQFAAYTQMIERLQGLPVFEDMTAEQMADLSPEEQAIATSVMGNEMASMENRRVAALLTQRGYNPDPVTNTPLVNPYAPDEVLTTQA